MSSFVSLVGYLFAFMLAGVLMILVTLLVGKLVRPARPNPEKEATYECGEPTIGSSWLQFDLRIYVVALLFVIFDVELAFFFPWATVFGKLAQLADRSLAVTSDEVAEAKATAMLDQLGVPVPGEPAVLESVKPAARRLAQIALVDLLVFFGVLLVGFAYLWHKGDIEWVWSTRDETQLAAEQSPAGAPAEVASVGSGTGS